MNRSRPAHILHTKCRQRARFCGLLRILPLIEEYGAPPLDHIITKHPRLRPRNVTMIHREKETILNAAPDDIRLWLLLCSGLAMRSGTASRIGPANYDPRRREMRFTTKCDEALTLPVTAEVAATHTAQERPKP